VENSERSKIFKGGIVKIPSLGCEKKGREYEKEKKEKKEGKIF
jgi:hypothetical protein